MPFPSLLRSFRFLPLPGLFAAAVLTAAEKSPADLAFEAARDAIVTPTPDGAKALEAGFAFFLGFPEEPRTQGLLPALARLAERLPEGERAGYTKAFEGRLAAALARADLPAAAREGILVAGALTELERQSEEERPAPGAAQAKIDALAARFPESRALPMLRFAHARLLSQADPVAGEAALARLAQSEDPAIASQAAAELRVARLRTTPLEMKFTAADGREVDVAKLRGKVVLIDFWATWCGPCIRELPNLIRVYEAYHGQGFEIVGISFENSGVIDEAAQRNPRYAGQPRDTAEQAAAKLAAAKAKLLAFTKERGMPWPQHYDGRYWENEFGRAYNIRSIPAMFLLDREGKVVDTNARGERLEPLVRKLLGLGS